MPALNLQSDRADRSDRSVDTVEQKIENRKAQLQQEERALNEIKDKVYADFCEELGIQSIDEYEGGSLAEARQRQEKLNSLSKMVCSPTRRACESLLPRLFLCFSPREGCSVLVHADDRTRRWKRLKRR